MGCDTHGKIKGYVRHEEIFNFIRQKYDENAAMSIKKKIVYSLSGCKGEYRLNAHSEDHANWYDICGRIDFRYKEEDRSLFYSYSNVNFFENLEYYSEYRLEDMVKSETTYLSLGYWGSSVEIIKEIVAQFGGGWIDKNDCDDQPYEPVEVNSDSSIKPVIHVTMEDIYKQFGGVVIIDK